MVARRSVGAAVAVMLVLSGMSGCSSGEASISSSQQRAIIAAASAKGVAAQQTLLDERRVGSGHVPESNLMAILDAGAPQVPDRGATLGRAIQSAVLDGQDPGRIQLLSQTVAALAAGRRSGGSEYSRRWSGLASPLSAAMGQVAPEVLGPAVIDGPTGPDVRAAAEVLRPGFTSSSSGYVTGLQRTLDQRAVDWRSSGDPGPFVGALTAGTTLLAALTTAVGVNADTEPATPEGLGVGATVEVLAARAILSHGLNTTRYLASVAEATGGFLNPDGSLRSVSALENHPALLGELNGWLDGGSTAAGRPPPGATASIARSVEIAIEDGIQRIRPS